MAIKPHSSEAPAQVPKNNSEQNASGMKKGIAIGAAAAFLAGGVGAALYELGESHGAAATSTSMDINGTGTHETQTPTKITLSSEAVASLNRFNSVSGQMLDGTIAELQQNGFDRDYFKIFQNDDHSPRTIQPSSPTMIPQAILDRDSAKQFWLTSNPNQQQALTDVEAFAQPGSHAAQDLINRINNDATVQEPVADESIYLSSKSFDNGSFVDPTTGDVVVTAHNQPTEIIGAMDERTRTNATYVFQYDQSPDGSTADWRMVNGAYEGKFGYSDPGHVDQIKIQDN